VSTRPNLWRALLALLVLGGTLALALTTDVRLGLDLKGGTQIILQTQDTKRVKADAEATDRAIGVLNGRINALGVADSTLTRSGQNRIIVELPDVQDPRKAAEVIGQTAQLTLHEVLGTGLGQPAPGQSVLVDERGAPILVGPAVLDGEGVSDAVATTKQQGLGEWVVDINFTGKGTGKWGDLVSAACADQAGGQRIAIVLDQQVISSPTVNEDLCASGGGSATTISGDFTQKSAKELALLIKGGALPVPVEIIQQNTIGPTLGDAAIHASVKAAILGVAITGLFIVFVYRIVGLAATLALGAYSVISYGLMVWLGVTLTLPGLAGFVLAIGLAIDANILQFERAREEYEKSPTSGILKALRIGAPKAWPAIIDSTITTLIAATLLFALAAGPVKGFGITLIIGTLASLFSGLVIARLFSELVLMIKPVRNHGATSGLASIGPVRRWLHAKSPQVTKQAGRWLAVTAVIAVFSIAGLVARGLNLGVEFTGGRVLEFSSAKVMDVDKARAAVAKAGFENAVVQRSSSNGVSENISVRVGNISNAQAITIAKSLEGVGGKVTKESDNKISASLGSELKKKALIAFVIALTIQMLYLAWRFRWTYSVGAVTSLASVVLTVVGVFAWWGKPIDGVFLASILSIIGLVVHDTIIVFDRIREHSAKNRDRNVREVLNEAILETIPRTVNTVLCAMFILIALGIFGGDSLTDFAIALIIGLGFGVISTVFTASSLAALLEERWPFDPQKAAQKAESIGPYSHLAKNHGDGAVV
jgi:SecD/SecF fusion protein